MNILITLLLIQHCLQALHQEYDYMKNLTDSELKQYFLGLHLPSNNQLQIESKIQYPLLKLLLNDTELPTEFDSRQKWPDCIHGIRNQQKCGSCWAFAASEVLSDRFCIATNGQVNVTLSPQYLLDCDIKDHGCHGGRLDYEFQFLKDIGITTEQCTPYKAIDTQQCQQQCADSNISFQLYKLADIKVMRNIRSIKQEIYENGPIETGFMVYRDFMSYRQGVYIPQPNKQFLGGHAVKIIGWGLDQTTNHQYWICANSWGQQWGENGYFKIKMGECNIDQFTITGTPLIQHTSQQRLMI